MAWIRCSKLSQVSNQTPTLQNTEASNCENYLPLSVYLTHSLPPPFHYPSLFPRAGPSSHCNSALSSTMKPVNGGRYEVTIISYAALLDSISLFKFLKQSLVFDLKLNVLMFKLFDSNSNVC